MPLSSRTKNVLRSSLANRGVGAELITILDTPGAPSAMLRAHLRNWIGSHGLLGSLVTILTNGVGLAAATALRYRVRSAIADRAAADEVIAVLSS